MQTLLGVFRSFSLLSVRVLSLLNLNFRAEHTFKSRMCRGIVGDAVILRVATLKWARKVVVKLSLLACP